MYICMYICMYIDVYACVFDVYACGVALGTMSACNPEEGCEGIVMRLARAESSASRPNLQFCV